MARCPKCGNDSVKFSREVSKGVSNSSYAHSVILPTGSRTTNRKVTHQTIGMCTECGYTWAVADDTTSKESHGILFWIIAVIFWPISLSVWFWKTKKIPLKPVVKAIILAVIWIVLFAVYGNSSKSDSNTVSTTTTTTIESIETEVPQNSASTTEENNSSSANTESQGISATEYIDKFVEEFNTNSDIPLDFVEDFTPADKDSTHYRVEFRLNAYDDAVGKSYKYGDATVDLVGRKSLNENIIRVYMSGATLDQCVSMLETASPIMDPDITVAELTDTVNEIKEKKEANGCYFADLGLVLQGNDVEGYTFMLKLGND